MAKEKTNEAPAFTKAQLVASKKYADKRDLINALLVDGESYTLEAVEALIENYLKGTVS